LGTNSEKVYNLGNGAGYSVLQVIEIARKVTGHPIPARMAPHRPGDPSMLVASSEKARAELGWAPRYPDLRDIILSAWQWHQQFPFGYGSSYEH
jgi:UDP-glucose 4-epimerase